MMGPRAMDARNSASLNRNPSTKQLISRYEAMTGLAPSSPSDAHHGHSLPSTMNASPFTKKDRKSSVRQSFRNLVGLLKKGESKLKLNQMFQRSRASLSAPSTVEIHNSSSYSSPVLEVPPAAIMSSSALYMARVSPDTSILPVWMACNLALEGSRLILSSFSMGGHPESHYIYLHECTDVRSHASSQLDEEELALIPKEYAVDELRFFELLFSSGPTERFAVTTVHDRANWVSCIWDVVLGSQKNDPAQQSHSILGILQSAEVPPHSQRQLPSLPPSQPVELEDQASDTLYPGTQFVLPSDATITAEATRTSVISSNKPLPALLPVNMDSNSVGRITDTGSFFNAYAGGSPPPRPSVPLLEDQPALSQDMATILRTVENLALDVAQGFGQVQRGMNEVSSRIDRSDTALLDMSQNVADLSRRPAVQAMPEQSESSHRPPAFDSSQLDHIANSAQTLHIISRELRSLIDTLEDRKRNDDLRVLKDDLQVLECANVPPSQQPAVTPPAAIPAPIQPPVDLAPLAQQIDSVAADIASCVAETREVKALLAVEAEQQASRDQQQADSVRYLNELNNWLEGFINNSASQSQAMHGTMESIRTTIGGGSDASTTPLSQMVLETRTCLEALRASVEGRGQGQSDGHGLTVERLSELLQHQSQNHNTMFHALATELTSEIRGERVRFVDAMKEATEINVRAHVEEFKKELKREVSAMTKEVGRLYRERQTMENQIAELFSFYTKQQQGLIPFATQPQQQQQRQGYHPRQHPGNVQIPQGQDLNQQHRPLPSPQRTRPGY